MRKFLGALCMLLGLALLAGAAWLLLENRAEESAAGDAAGTVMSEMRAAMEGALSTTGLASPGASVSPDASTSPDASASPDASISPDASVSPESTLMPEATPVPQATPIPEMPTMTIDGETYIGYLEMPTIGLTLPVMSDWSYPKLRIAPCRYWGSVYDNSMVIMAHNYDRHFGRIATLELGDPVQFVCADGEIFSYVVSGHETLQPREVDRMLDGSADLTLFTCTYGGRTRVTVRLSRVLAY